MVDKQSLRYVGIWTVSAPLGPGKNGFRWGITSRRPLASRISHSHTNVDNNTEHVTGHLSVQEARFDGDSGERANLLWSRRRQQTTNSNHL